MLQLRSLFSALTPIRSSPQDPNAASRVEPLFVRVLESKEDLFVPVMQQYLSNPLASSENVDLFIRHGKANINVKNPEGMPFLIEALDKNHPRAFKRLLQYPEIQLKQVDRRGRTPFLAAVIHGNLPVIQHLTRQLDVKPDANSPEGKAALRWAIRRGDPKMLGYLLELWETSIPSQSKAAMKQKRDCLLQQDRVNQLIESRPEDPALMAQAMTEWLERLGESATTYSSAFETAVIQHHAAGYDLNTRPPDGFTPLIYAAILGSAEAAQALLMTGVDLDGPLQNGQTALMTAALCRKAEVAQILINAGADVNRPDKNGNTALFYLGCSPEDEDPQPPSPELATMLIKAGAHVNHRDKKGATPLHYALSFYKGPEAVPMIRVLLAAGAKVGIKDKAGRTPLKWAEKLKVSPQIIQTLREHASAT